MRSSIITGGPNPSKTELLQNESRFGQTFRMTGPGKACRQWYLQWLDSTQLKRSDAHMRHRTVIIGIGSGLLHAGHMTNLTQLIQQCMSNYIR